MRRPDFEHSLYQWLSCTASLVRISLLFSIFAFYWTTATVPRPTAFWVLILYKLKSSSHVGCWFNWRVVALPVIQFLFCGLTAIFYCRVFLYSTSRRAEGLASYFQWQPQTLRSYQCHLTSFLRGNFNNDSANATVLTLQSHQRS